MEFSSDLSTRRGHCYEEVHYSETVVYAIYIEGFIFPEKINYSKSVCFEEPSKFKAILGQ